MITLPPTTSSKQSSGGEPLNRTRVLPLFDVFLDLPHPATSFSTSKVNVPGKAVIIAPPPAAIEASRSVGKEIVSDNGLDHLARFAFPEFHDQIHAQEVASIQSTGAIDSEAGLNKYDIYASDFYGGSSSTDTRLLPFYPYVNALGPSYHTFAMQLSSGERLYGHVRRYLPKHALAQCRVDVGRRAVRAMIILTRFSGGEKFFCSLLQTVEATSHLKIMMLGLDSCTSSLEKLLHSVYNNHIQLCAKYAAERMTKVAPTAPQQDVQTKVDPNIMSISGLEFDSNLFDSVDVTQFILPQSLLQPYCKDDTYQTSTSLILPFFRCLGISNGLRLLSALLCERRVILVSKSPSRLSACGRSALSILAQGLLHWQHVYIPIVPPTMLTYLAAPVPYLMGLLLNHASAIPRIPGLGEVVVVDLDLNKLQTHNISNPHIAIPDLLRAPINYNDNTMAGGSNSFQDNLMSPIDVLVADLTTILKNDKNIMSLGETGVQQVLGNVAEKGKKLLKMGFGRLKERILASQSDIVEDEVADGEGSGQDNIGDSSPDVLSVEEHTFAFGEGVENECCEEEVRCALTQFFLSLFGDMRWYLRAPTTAGQPPTLDKDLFLATRKNLGDRENTPIYQLLYLFKDTQMFEQFVRLGVEDLVKRMPVLMDAPLFILATNYLRTNRIPLSSLEIRQVVRQMSQYSSCRFLLIWSRKVRTVAVGLTSNSREEASYQMEITNLLKNCRESTYNLVEVMGVIWERMRDCRGMQWKHGLYSLQLLRELILNGPLSAVASATEQLGKIRKLTRYENIRSSAVEQIRMMANEVYYLLIHQASLFHQRRYACMLRKENEISRVFYRLRVTSKDLKGIHSMVQPKGSELSATNVSEISGQMSAPTECIDLLSMPPATTIEPSNRPLESSTESTYAAELLSSVDSFLGAASCNQSSRYSNADVNKLSQDVDGMSLIAPSFDTVSNGDTVLKTHTLLPQQIPTSNVVYPSMNALDASYHQQSTAGPNPLQQYHPSQFDPMIPQVPCPNQYSYATQSAQYQGVLNHNYSSYSQPSNQPYPPSAQYQGAKVPDQLNVVGYSEQIYQAESGQAKTSFTTKFDPFA